MIISFLFAAPSLSLICVLEKDEVSTGFVCLFVSLRGGINCTHLLINTVSLHEAVRLEEFQWRVEGLERCSAGCDKNCGFQLSGGHRNVIHTPTQSAGDWTVGAGEKRMWGFFLKKRHQDVMKREWEQKKKKIVTVRKTSHETVERRRKKSSFSQEQMKEKERLWGAVGRRRSISCPY